MPDHTDKGIWIKLSLIKTLREDRGHVWVKPVLGLQLCFRPNFFLIIPILY